MLRNDLRFHDNEVYAVTWRFTFYAMFYQRQLLDKYKLSKKFRLRKIQETLFNVGFHKQITLGTRAIFLQTRV